MGFYLGLPSSEALHGVRPTLTPAEYVSVFANVLRGLGGRGALVQEAYGAGSGNPANGQPKLRIKTLLSAVRRNPCDPSANRMLGMAYVETGNVKAAVKHLEISLELLQREMDEEPSLYETCRLQCQAAVLRLVLVPLYVSLGRRVAARRLLLEAFLAI